MEGRKSNKKGENEGEMEGQERIRMDKEMRGEKIQGN